MFAKKLSGKQATSLIYRITNEHWHTVGNDLPIHREKGSDAEYLTRAFREAAGIDYVAPKLSECLDDSSIQLPSAALVV